MVTSNELSFNTLAETFLRDLRAKRVRSVEEFAAGYPEQAEVIRRDFPAILLAEQMRFNSLASRQSQIPKQLGRYLIETQIGKGGMGQVYAAKDPELKRDVAIKVLALRGIKSPAMLARFHIEAQASAMLDHSNIVPVYDHGTSEDVAYLVMKRIRGLSLDRIVARLSEEHRSGKTDGLRMDWNVIANIGAQVASALSYAHSKGIIHRDIKPANLILEGIDKVWVTDFGLAKLLAANLELSVAGDIIGTPKYMAPEQFRGLCDQRSDVYGLGLTLYELASGRPVWESITAKEIVASRHSLELPELKDLNPAIPPAICDIIMKSCAFLPEERYQSASELNFVLTRYAHGNPVGDRRRNRNQERSIWRRKSWMVAGISGFVASIAVVSGGINYALVPENPFQNPTTALKVLENDGLRDRFVQELPGLINEMVKNDDPRFRSAVGTLAENAILKTVKQYDIDEKDKNVLEKKVSGWVNAYKAGEISMAEGGTMMHGFAGSPVATVLKFQRLEHFLANSTFTPDLRTKGYEVLRRLQIGLTDGRIRHAQSGQLLDDLEVLAATAVPDTADPSILRVTDEQLMQYLHKVFMTVEAAGIQENPGKIKAADQITEAVEETLKNPEMQQMIRQQIDGFRHLEDGQRPPNRK